MKFTAACIQTNSQDNLTQNIEQATALIEQAALQNADLICLPENVAFMANNAEELLKHCFSPEQHPALEAFQQCAKKHKRWILVGSLSVKVPNDEKIANRCFLINNHGSIVSTYDKIHLYDVDVEGGEKHQESKRYIAGNKAVLAETPWATLGMTICYDLRFPYLYRHLAQAGASIITIPSSFTQFTGQAHWHVLLRARAIETGSYVIAPAQTGSHPANRKTYGHSLIISPWGEVLAEADEKKGVITAEIDTENVEYCRKNIPSLKNNFNIT